MYIYIYMYPIGSMGWLYIDPSMNGLNLWENISVPWILWVEGEILCFFSTNLQQKNATNNLTGGERGTSCWAACRGECRFR